MTKGHDVDLVQRLKFEEQYMARQLTPQDWKDSVTPQWHYPPVNNRVARKKIAELSLESMRVSLQALGN